MHHQTLMSASHYSVITISVQHYSLICQNKQMESVYINLIVMRDSFL